MAESPVATSTPDNESTYHRRREERAQRFLSGTSRAAYRLDPLLERSLSTSISDISQGSESGSEDIKESLRVRRQVMRRVECKHGCPAVLKRMMSKAYESFRKHTGKTGVVIQTRRILKDRQEISLVSVLLKRALVIKYDLSLSLSLAQNQRIRESLFDGHGNYVYCYECILAYIDVGPTLM